ncbi:hypothetical protein V2J09_009205 [Rumex salicifolius]
MMNCLLWNCRGANNDGFRGITRYMIKHYAIDILELIETKVLGGTAKKACDKLPFSHSYRVEARGFIGGIWPLWQGNNFDLQIIDSNDSFIHASVSRHGKSFKLFVVYAPPSPARRREFRDTLSSTTRNINLPLFVGGDFNCIPKLNHLFTWGRGNSVQTKISKRLDRVFINSEARLDWPEACVFHLPIVKPDHAPILLSMKDGCSGSRVGRPFHFECAWMEHPNFFPLMEEWWQKDKEKEASFGKNCRHSSRLCKGVSTKIWKSNFRLRRPLGTKSNCGYRNPRSSGFVMETKTQFFQVSTLVRRARNKIQQLKDEAGNCAEDEMQLKTHGKEFLC